MVHSTVTVSRQEYHVPKWYPKWPAGPPLWLWLTIHVSTNTASLIYCIAIFHYMQILAKNVQNPSCKRHYRDCFSLKEQLFQCRRTKEAKKHANHHLGVEALGGLAKLNPVIKCIKCHTRIIPCDRASIKLLYHGYAAALALLWIMTRSINIISHSHTANLWPIWDHV